MQTLLAVLGALAVSSLCMFVLVRRVVRAVRRRIRRLTERVRLAARAHGVGPGAEVAWQRREMERALDGARRALAAAREVHSPVGDVPSLLARLELAARAVDGELRVLEAQSDPVLVAKQLAGPGSRAEVICCSAAKLVDGLLQAAAYDAEELTLLETACAIEADALRAAGRPSQGAPRRQAPADRRT